MPKVTPGGENKVWPTERVGDNPLLLRSSRNFGQRPWPLTSGSIMVKQNNTAIDSGNETELKRYKVNLNRQKPIENHQLLRPQASSRINQRNAARLELRCRQRHQPKMQFSITMLTFFLIASAATTQAASEPLGRRQADAGAGNVGLGGSCDSSDDCVGMLTCVIGGGQPVCSRNRGVWQPCAVDAVSFPFADFSRFLDSVVLILSARARLRGHLLTMLL